MKLLLTTAFGLVACERRSFTAYTDAITLEQGQISNGYYRLKIPMGPIAIYRLAAEIVEFSEDGNVIPTPSYDAYLHHQVIGTAHMSYENEKDKWTPMRPKGTYRGVGFGVGAEARGTPQEFAYPFAFFTTEGEDEWVANVHIINTRGLTPDQAHRCVECPCTSEDHFTVDGRINGHKNPLKCNAQLLYDNNTVCSPQTYKGGLWCCGSGKYCLEKTELSSPPPPKSTYYMQYTIDYDDIQPGNRELYLAGCCDASGDLFHQGAVEYDVPQCDQISNPGCVYTVATRQHVSAGGNIFLLGHDYHVEDREVDIVYAVGHQHRGGLGVHLFNDKTNEHICTSMPTYGHGTEAGNEAGYIRSMSSCTFNPPLRMRTSDILRVVASYDSTSGHTGVMSVWYLAISDVQSTNSTQHSANSLSVKDSKSVQSSTSWLAAGAMSAIIILAMSNLISLAEFQERVLAESGHRGHESSSVDQSPRTAYEEVIVINGDEDDILAIAPATQQKNQGLVIAYLVVLGFVGGALHVLCQWLINMILELRQNTMKYPSTALVFWTLYTVIFLVAAVLWTKLSPSAAGSGIAQMKTVLTGIDPTLYLPGYFSPLTLVAKVGGLISANGAGLQIGTEGAFVHIMAVVAHCLLQLRVFHPLQDRLSVRLQLLAASSAVAVSSAFGSPIGGVLFSIEVTATYYLISNYMKAFISSVAAAIMVLWTNSLLGTSSLLDQIVINAEPYKSLVDIPLSILLGVLMGLLSAAILSASQYIADRRCHYSASELPWVTFLVNWADPLLIGVITAVSTYFATQHHEIYSLPDLLSENPIGNIKSLAINAGIPLALLPLSITLKFPTGVWLPTFIGGAACGRLFAMTMNMVFPHLNLSAASFALVGVGCLTGSATRTISAAVIALEITGNVKSLLPVLCGVLVSIATSAISGLPSMYDILSEANALPYLPHMEFSSNQTVGGILQDKVVCLTRSTSILQVLLALNRLPSHEIPVVCQDKKLLGVISKEDLEHIVERFYTQHKLEGWERDWGEAATSSHKSVWTTKTVPTVDHIYTTLYRRPSSSVNLRLLNNCLYPVHPTMLMNDDKMTELLSHDWSPEKRSILLRPIELPTESIRPLGMTLSAETTLEDVYLLFTMLRMDHCYVTDMGKLIGVVTTRSLIKAAAK